MTLSDLMHYAKKVVLTIIGAVLLVYVLIILLSYSPDDPSWTHIGQVKNLTNMGGSVGAWIADFILTFIGNSVWLLLSFVVYEVLLLWWQRKVMNLQLRLVVYILLISAMSGFFASLNIVDGNFVDQSSGKIALAHSVVENMLEDGGIIGYEFAVNLLSVIGKIGTWVFLAFLVAVLTVVAFSIRWKQFLPFAVSAKGNSSQSYEDDLEEMRLAQEMRKQAFVQANNSSHERQETQGSDQQLTGNISIDKTLENSLPRNKPIEQPVDADDNLSALTPKQRFIRQRFSEERRAEQEGKQQKVSQDPLVEEQPTTSPIVAQVAEKTTDHGIDNNYQGVEQHQYLIDEDNVTTFIEPVEPVIDEPLVAQIQADIEQQAQTEQIIVQEEYQAPPVVTEAPVIAETMVEETVPSEKTAPQPTEQFIDEPVAEPATQGLYFDYFSDDEPTAPQADPVVTYNTVNINNIDINENQPSEQVDTISTSVADSGLQFNYDDYQQDYEHYSHNYDDYPQSQQSSEEDLSNNGLLMDYSDVPLEGEKKNLKNPINIDTKTPQRAIKKIGASIKNMIKTVADFDEDQQHEPSQPQSQQQQSQPRQVKQKLHIEDLADDKAFKGKSRARETVKRRKRLSKLPSLDILDKPDPNRQPSYTVAELEELSILLEEKLQDFNVQAQVVNAIPGPVVTRFEVELAPGVKVAKVTNVSRDLARSLSMASLRVVEIIPGKPYIGIEVPNRQREMVRLIELLDTKSYRSKTAQISIAMGKDIGGKPIITDLAKAPHMLVAGTTGSGKSVLVNCMLLSMLLKYTPDQLKLILIDPKQLELANYNDIPHLLTPVVTDMTEAAGALSWCVAEMEKRYQLMSLLRVRKLDEFNKKVVESEKAGQPIIDPLWRPNDSVSIDQAPKLKPLPMIVIVADEFADMIMQVGKQAEELITRLAQKSRAAGIHLMLATQRPSVDVITGLIKANVPVRAGLRVNSKIDSRTILDTNGAEDMLGNGDMLFLGPGQIEADRVHGAFVSDEEVNRVCEAWRERGDPEYIENFAESFKVEDPINGGTTGGTSGADDSFYNEAVAFVMETRKVSASSIQRKFSIGYNRAARIVDSMEEAGIVGPMIKGKREILM